MSEPLDILDELMSDMGLKDPEPATPEEGLYNYWVNGKPYPKIYNCQYWLKHELFVYTSLKDKGWFVSKPNGIARSQVSLKELARAFLEYYFQMVTLSSFVNERAKEQGKLVDLHKFVELVIEHPTIKKLIEDPNALI